MRRGVVFSVIVSIVFCAPVLAYDWATNPGDGSAENPYQISTADEWIELTSASAIWNKHFILTADIDFEGATITPVARDTSSSGGYQGTAFTGTFDGGGHVLKNFVLNQPASDFVGLFGQVGSGGRILNLGVEPLNIIGRSYVGGLCGYNLSGTIQGCNAKGSIHGDLYTGGAVGLNDGGNCSETSFTGSIFCKDINEVNCGGFVGFNTNNGSITRCYASSSISLEATYTQSKIGGFAGTNNSGTISQCGNWSSILCGPQCNPDYLGGFVGSSKGIISNCYSNGRIQTNNKSFDRIGGFAGFSSGSILHCYTTVTQEHRQIDINRGYVIGAFAGDYNSISQWKGCFFDILRTNNLINKGAQPLSTRQMKDAFPYLNAGWDFENEDDNGTQDVWRIDENDYPKLSWMPRAAVPEVTNLTFEDAQILIESSNMKVGRVLDSYSDSVPAGRVTMQSMLSGQHATVGAEIDLWISDGQLCLYSGGGEGTPQNPCRITNANDLILLAQNPSDYNKCFLLINDINMDPVITGIGPFSGAVIPSHWGAGDDWYSADCFEGLFDGGGHSISNLKITVSSPSSWIGFFGQTFGAKVCNLNLENIRYACKSSDNHFSWSGGLIGECFVTQVTDCTVSGAILGNSGGQLGGLAGKSAYSVFKRCHTDTEMTGGDYLGGFIGYSNSTIIGCSAITNITAKPSYMDLFYGGLVGANYGDISCSVSINSINGARCTGGLAGHNEGSITNCYARGSVSGKDRVGGVVGMNYGILSKCYSSAVIVCPNVGGGLCGYNYSQGGISDSYFLQGAGPDNGYGIPLDNHDMMLQASFVDWDFNSIWWIDEGKDYPIFKWQMPNTAPVADASDIVAYACVDGLAEVRLDGTGSWDADGDALTYSWYNDANELIAVGAEPNVVFGVGEHVIRLVVNDGIEDSLLDACVVTVIPIRLEVVEKERLGRSTFAYTLAAVFENTHAYEMLDVEIRLVDADEAVLSVEDDLIVIGAIAPGQIVTTQDTFAITVDRSVPILAGRLTLEVSYSAQGQQAAAKMSMPLSILEPVQGDISGDGKVNFGDLAILSEQWQQAPSEPSADIAPPADGFVGLEDLVYLAEHWLEGTAG